MSEPRPPGVVALGTRGRRVRSEGEESGSSDVSSDVDGLQQVDLGAGGTHSGLHPNGNFGYESSELESEVDFEEEKERRLLRIDEATNVESEMAIKEFHGVA
ncbi:unnamed protein product [Cyprideis torosa]|uniref:Uncharacterized protein n=1 Tax=Cyprideis torosa TaxID=163714 RepID=A0A7R8WVW8_9CRUS|nr:unnamed protein product [Cyprideis torosa]CAG0910010.1 unnamed protein product [Cyprideis torosa]